MFRVLDAYGRVRSSVINTDGPAGDPGANGLPGGIGHRGLPGRDGSDAPRLGPQPLVRLYQDVEGNLPVNRLNGGLNADGFTTWRGDGTWAEIGDGNGSGQPEIYIAPDGTNPIGVNDVAQTTPGAGGTIVNDSDGQWCRMTSSVDGTPVTARSTSTLCWPEHNPIFRARVRTGSVLTNVRIWIGLTSAAFTNVDTHAGSCVAIRYSTVAGDGGWVGVTRAGGTQNVTSTIASIAASTKYNIKIAVTGGGTSVTFTVDNSTQTTSLTIPTGTSLLMAVAVIRVSTANKILDYRHIKLWR